MKAFNDHENRGAEETGESGWNRVRLLHPPRTKQKRNRGVRGDPACAKNQHNQDNHQKREGGGGNELVRIGKEGEQRFAVADNISHGQVHCKNQSCNPGGQTESERNAAKELDAGYENSHLRGHRQAESGKVLTDVGQIMELAPAALSKLPSPIEPY